MPEQSQPSSTASPGGTKDSSSRAGKAFAAIARPAGGPVRLPVVDISKLSTSQNTTPSWIECACGREMHPKAAVCDFCEDAAVQAKRLAARWKARNGVTALHGKIRRWDDLNAASGKYGAVIGKVRAFLNAPESLVLALTGDRGTGKTQMGSVAVLQCEQRGLPAVIVPALDLVADLKGTFGETGNAERGWLDKWAGPWLLVVDEWQNRAESEYANSWLYRLVDARYTALRRTIIIANCQTSAEFGALVGAGIADRCRESGGVLVCDWPSFRGRAEQGENRGANEQNRH